MFKDDNLFPVLSKWNDDRGDIKSIWSECLSGQAWQVWYLKWKHFKINWWKWNSYVISKCSYKINDWGLNPVVAQWPFSHTEPPTHWLTDVMLAAATISRLLTNLLHRTIVTKATTHTPRSGHRRRIILQGSSNGSLQYTHTCTERLTEVKHCFPSSNTCVQPKILYSKAWAKKMNLIDLPSNVWVYHIL